MRRRTVRRWLIAGTTGACVAAAALAATVENRSAAPRTDATAAEELPLGAATLDETRTSRELAPGVTHIAIERGRKSADDFWTVTIGVATSEAEAAELERKVRAAGYAPRRDRTAGPDPQGPADRPLGWMVRVGRYADRAAADRAKDEITARGLPGSVQHTSEDGHATTGPWSLDVLVVDPARFRGRL
ncbi:SPOR domain-containing protein, partial [Streptomyces pharetrae]